MDIKKKKNINSKKPSPSTENFTLRNDIKNDRFQPDSQDLFIKSLSLVLYKYEESSLKKV